MPFQPFTPRLVRAARTLQTRYGIVRDPGYEGLRDPPSDPWIGIQQANIFTWDRANLEEMLNGRPPWGFDGKKVILHHRAQQPNGPLDEYSATLHQEQSKSLHDQDYTRVDRDQFAGQRARYWVTRARRHLSVE